MADVFTLRKQVETELGEWVLENRSFLYEEIGVDKIKQHIQLDFGDRCIRSIKSGFDTVTVWAIGKYVTDQLAGVVDRSWLQTACESQLSSFLCTAALALPPGVPGNGLTFAAGKFCFLLARTIAAGWRPEAELVARLGFDGLHTSLIDEGIGETRLPFVMLEIAKDWLGADKADLNTRWRGIYMADLGLWQELIEHWREPDGDVFEALMHRMAEWHCEQSHELIETGRQGSKSYKYQKFDIMEPSYFVYPVELLAVLRLREWEGLRNPPLSHPLFTATALGRLGPPLARGPHPVVAAGEARFRAEFPDTPSIAGLAALRAKQGGRTRYQ